MSFKMKKPESPRTQDKPANPTHRFIPDFEVKLQSLPSKGLPYPDNATIKYRPYVFGDVKKISQVGSRGEISKRSEFLYVLEGIDCSFDKLGLTVFDVSYLGFLRRLATLPTNKYNVEFSCGQCGHKGRRVFDYETLDFKYMEAPDLPVVAPIGGKELSFYPLTIGEYFELCDKGLETDEMSILVKMIDAPDSEFDSNYEFIGSLFGKDLEILGQVDEYLSHSLKPLEFKCGGQISDGICDNDISLVLDGGGALILPFRGSDEPPPSGIRFGNGAAHKSSTSK